MLKHKSMDGGGPGRLDTCPFCGADLEARSPTHHLENCREFYHAFDKEPPESAGVGPDQDQESPDPDPEYSEASSTALKHAKEAGKWVGRAPAGFEVVDSYLQVDAEVFVPIADALKRIDAGESQRSVSRETDVVHNSTLRRIHADRDRRRIYMELRADDQRIQAALDEWCGGPETN